MEAWIDIRERMPAERDADVSGRILVWHVLNGCMVVGWFKARGNRFVTHWMPLPEGPEGFRQMRWEALRGTNERWV